MLRSIFYNQNEKRLRTGWRILVFFIMFWVLSSSIFLIKPLFGNVGKSAFVEEYSLLVISILALAATASVYLARRKFDKESFISLGLDTRKFMWKDLLFGFMLSGFMASLFFGVACIFGWIEFNGFHSFSWFPEGNPESFASYMKSHALSVLLLLLLETVLVGYWEELVFRGYLFQNLANGIGQPGAVALTCIIFGLIHWTNPNATLLSTSIIILFGFLRIWGYLLTNMLWLSIGMHIGWNFFQGPVFGGAASGHQSISIFNLTATGPEWLSGGPFGPEGSLIIVFIIPFILWIMHEYQKRKMISPARSFS